MAIKPIRDRILVEPLDKEVEKVGSLYVPDTAKEKTPAGQGYRCGRRLKRRDKIIL